ncbi:hypothetical protein Cgig2_011174 [Carnegiea gigantea]|uniref:Helicase C-terminal domain-containing protein n=1 Tax=Carnegiea gigantea TaxID=171969 RepID=A0A9Q1GR23_9CARY|nr:hypothetical protein Cgig2_011174 [Carnegiea gigantea]
MKTHFIFNFHRIHANSDPALSVRLPKLVVDSSKRTLWNPRLNENGDIKPAKKPAAMQHALTSDLYNELNQLTGLPSDKYASKVNEKKRQRDKCKEDQVSSESAKMLQYREAIEEKLKLKVISGSAEPKTDRSKRHEMFMDCNDSSTKQREVSMDRLNNSPTARLLFGSIKAYGEGISLMGAFRIIIFDVHFKPSVSHQAIGRPFRLGQERKVNTYLLVTSNALMQL